MIAYHADGNLILQQAFNTRGDTHCIAVYNSINAVNNKLLVTLSAIAVRQSKAMVATGQAVNLLLDYIATYPNDSIIYQASNMILYAHSDVEFLNKTQAWCQAGVHIFLLENVPFPCLNGAVLSIAQNYQSCYGICCRI